VPKINDLLPHNWVFIDVSKSNCLKQILISSACPETMHSSDEAPLEMRILPRD